MRLNERAYHELCSEMGKEVFHFWLAHFAGMAFVVEEDVAADPVGVGIFCAVCVATEADLLMDLV